MLLLLRRSSVDYITRQCQNSLLRVSKVRQKRSVLPRFVTKVSGKRHLFGQPLLLIEERCGALTFVPRYLLLQEHARAIIDLGLLETLMMQLRLGSGLLVLDQLFSFFQNGCLCCIELGAKLCSDLIRFDFLSD